MITKLFSRFVKIKIEPISYQVLIFDKVIIEFYSSLLQTINQFHNEFYLSHKRFMMIFINDMNFLGSKKIVADFGSLEERNEFLSRGYIDEHYSYYGF